MVRVDVRRNADSYESALEEALRKFKKLVNKDGLLTEVKQREYYIKPGEKRRKAKEASRRAALKKLKKRGY